MEIKSSSLVSGISGLLVLIFFFMPWITVSCGSASIDLTGYELTTGNISEEGSEVEQVEEERGGDTLLWIIPIAGLVALGIFGIRVMGLLSDLSPSTSAGILIAAGLIGLVIQILKYFALQEDAKELESSGGSLQYEIGWWLTMFSLIAIAVGGFLEWQSNATTPDINSPST